jgi:hypothetical protein
MLNKKQLIDLVQRYSIDQFNLGEEADSLLFINYQALNKKGKFPLWKSTKKKVTGAPIASENIEPVQGAWSRNARVELQVHAKDVLQPFNKDGQINKHFVQAHGTKTLEKETKLSEKQIRDSAERYG